MLPWFLYTSNKQSVQNTMCCKHIIHIYTVCPTKLAKVMNQKSRVQEHVKVEESCTLKFPWTHFLSFSLSAHFLTYKNKEQGIF